MAERQRVAQWDEIAGFFGSHDAGQARHAEHIALFGAAAFNQRAGSSQHLDAAAGDSPASCCGFVAYVHHVRLALGVKMGERLRVGWGHGFF